MKRTYELVVILDSEIKTDEQEQTVSLVKKMISNAKAELVSSDDWGKKEFAFPINKKTSGRYLLLEFQIEPEDLLSLRQKLQLEEKIIRYLLTLKEEKPKAVKQAEEKPVVKKKPVAKKAVK